MPPSATTRSLTKAHDRVGHQAARRVRAAALDAQDELAQIALLAAAHARLDYHAAGYLLRLGDGFDGAALLLDEQRLDGLIRAGLELREEVVHAVYLTAEADGDDAVDIRVRGQAYEHIARAAQILAGFSAAVLVHEAHRPAESLGRKARRLGGAAHGGEDENVIPRAHAAVRPPVAPEFHSLSPPLVMLWLWTQAPAGMSSVAWPITSPYL